jgi:hypothetical protein
MQERFIGPVNGYFVNVTALITGVLGESFLGVAKVCATPAPGFFDADPLQTIQCPSECSRVEDALNWAEDLAVDAASAAPARTAAEAVFPLWAITYVSRANAFVDAAQVEQLMVAARKRNLQLGISGMLVYFDETFMQYIEGPRPQLELVYRIIRKDSLHSGLIKLVKAGITERVFPDWSMLFESPIRALWTLRSDEPPAAPHLAYAAQVKTMLTLFLERHGARDEMVQAARRRIPGAA